MTFWPNGRQQLHIFTNKEDSIMQKDHAARLTRLNWITFLARLICVLCAY